MCEGVYIGTRGACVRVLYWEGRMLLGGEGHVGRNMFRGRSMLSGGRGRFTTFDAQLYIFVLVCGNILKLVLLSQTWEKKGFGFQSFATRLVQVLLKCHQIIVQYVSFRIC